MGWGTIRPGKKEPSPEMANGKNWDGYTCPQIVKGTDLRQGSTEGGQIRRQKHRNSQGTKKTMQGPKLIGKTSRRDWENTEEQKEEPPPDLRLGSSSLIRE